MSNANSTNPTALTYDYIIAGAGGAGLSLLHYLLASPVLSNQQILVIDQSLQKTNDRTWCFWAIFFQMFLSMNLFIERVVDRTFFGYTIPTTIFLAIESFGVIFFGPVLSLIWQDSFSW